MEQDYLKELKTPAVDVYSQGNTLDRTFTVAYNSTRHAAHRYLFRTSLDEDSTVWDAMTKTAQFGIPWHERSLSQLLHAACLAPPTWTNPICTHVCRVAGQYVPVPDRLLAPSGIFKVLSVMCAYWALRCRDFVMNGFNLTEDQAITAITVAMDFGVTQVVDGNWCAPPAAQQLIMRVCACVLLAAHVESCKTALYLLCALHSNTAPCPALLVHTGLKLHPCTKKAKMAKESQVWVCVCMLQGCARHHSQVDVQHDRQSSLHTADGVRHQQARQCHHADVSVRDMRIPTQ